MGAEANPHAPDLPYFPTTPFASAEAIDGAPVRFVNEVELPVSAEGLFDVFEDPDSWSRWATGIGRVLWTSPAPYGPGTTRTVVFWGGMQVYETFLDFDRGRSMAFTFTGTTQEVWRRFGERYTVTPLGADRCRLRWVVGYEPTGVFAWIHPVLRPVMALNLRSYMWLLRRYCARRRAR